MLGYFLDNEDSCPPVPSAALPLFLGLPPHTHGSAEARQFVALHGGEMTPDALAAAFAARVATQYFHLTTVRVYILWRVTWPRVPNGSLHCTKLPPSHAHFISRDGVIAQCSISIGPRAAPFLVH